jgi:hypothetical protein
MQQSVHYARKKSLTHSHIISRNRSQFVHLRTLNAPVYVLALLRLSLRFIQTAARPRYFAINTPQIAASTFTVAKCEPPQNQQSTFQI